MLTKVRKPKVLSRDVLREQYETLAGQIGLSVEVFSDGPVQASMAFVGEGPGETEVRRGLPFVGGTGNMLWDATAKYGFTRDTVYVTNVVKRQISLSRKGNARHAVTQDELNHWVGLLQWELGQLPNVDTIFILGNYALDAVLGLDGITKYRGSVLDCDLPNGKRGKVVCTFNPAYCMPDREPRFEVFFRLDCAKLSLAGKRMFREHKIDELINPTYREAKAFLRDLRKSARPIAADVEFINQEIACIGFSNDPHKAMCISLRDTQKNVYTVSEEADLMCDMQDTCDSHRMIGQNAQFDAYATQLHYLLRMRFWFDTLLAHHTLYPVLPHGLAFLVSQYTNHPFYKDDAESWKEGGDIDTFWRYNCKDSALTYAVYEKELDELRKTKLDKFFFDHVMRAQPHMIDATVHGVLVDQKMKEIINEQVQADVVALREKFHQYCQELTGEEDYRPNPNSWQQLQDLFFKRLGLEGRGSSTDEDNRNLMLVSSKTSPMAKEMLVSLNKFKEEDKFRGTYAESKTSEDGRFRCEHKQYGVAKAPGRISTSQLLVTKDGGNLQNQPMRARGQFIADPGCVFIYFDLAQAEAQVVSFRADIHKWKEQYARAKIDGSYDSHRALASEMFKIPYDQVPKKDWDESNQPTKRYVAKRCRHGLNYRMQSFRLSQVTQLPYHEAVTAFHLYHRITPELQRWWKEQERQFKQEKEIYNALGRRFSVIQRIDDSVLESIIAFYPQSTIGDKITQVWYQAEEDDDWPDSHSARIAIDVHDNLVGICTPRVAKTALKILKKYAESPLYIQDIYKKRPPEPLSIPCELKMSYPSSWSEKAKKNKSGLWVPGFVEDPNGLHRWSEMKVVDL